MFNPNLLQIDNLGFKNRIINGDFSVWQRGTNVQKTTTTGYNFYGVDRFGIFTESDGDKNFCTITNTKVNNNNSNVCSINISNVDTTVTGRKVGIGQKVEANLYKDLIGKNITLSFWIKTSKPEVTLNFTHSYKDSSGNQQSEVIYTDVKEVIPGIWNKIIVTFTLTSDALTNPNNTSEWIELFNLSIDNVVDNDYIELSEVQVEEGDVATDFEPVPAAITLLRCMRYYETVNFGDNNRAYAVADDGKNETDYYQFLYMFRAVKYKIPTVTATFKTTTPSGNPANVTNEYVLFNNAAKDNGFVVVSLTAEAEI